MPRVPLHTTLDDGIDNVNFFNGRVLTAEDLRDEQRAGIEHRRRLGRAIGAGIVHGLDASPGDDLRSVTVQPGLALDPLGDVVELATAIDVALVVEEPGDGTPTDSPFAPCTTVPTAPTVSGDGFYLLTIAQAARQHGRAAAVGFGPGGVAADCGARYTAEGVAFGLVGLDVAGMAADSGLDEDAQAALAAAPGSAARLRTRNVLSHLLLDTALLAAEDAAPLDAEDPGALASLRASGRLTDCDVPLALVAWSDGQLEFLDAPAVRRPPVPAAHPAPGWETLVGARRPGVRAAALAQFELQARGLATGPGAASVQAPDHFRFLPAAGFLPLELDWQTFFTGVPHAFVGPIAPARIEGVLRHALAHPPIDLLSGEYVYLFSLGDDDQAQPVAFVSADLFYGGFLAEARDTLALTSLEPPRPLVVGETFRIKGTGLADATVSVDDVAAAANAISDTELEATVPELDVAAGGGRVEIHVEARGAARTAFLDVLPAGALAGGLTIARLESRALAGRALAVRYTVRSDLSETADVTLEGDAEVGAGLTEVRLDPPALDGLQPGEEREVVLRARVLRGLRFIVAPEYRVTLRASAGAIEATDVLEGP